MRRWITIPLIMIIVPAVAQRSGADFNRIDQRVMQIRPAPPPILAQQLTSFCSTDLEKVRAIFLWITQNISYRTSTPSKKDKGADYQPDNDTSALKPLDERVAEMVLEKGTAVCDGYARLFKTLCDYAGIRSQLVTGYARTEASRTNQRFRSNHTWNAVMIDSAWRLLDVTWASGFITWWGDSFVRHFDEAYFLTPPDQFITEHFPDDLRWSLMSDPPMIPEFRYSPYRQRTFMKYSITACRPAKGVIEVSPGDTIQVELEIADAEKDKQIGTDPFLDTAVYSTPASILLTPALLTGNKVTYRYTVTSPFVKWVYILYNGDVILRYRLNVRGRGIAKNEF